jgi:hypothetical protein
MADVFEAISRFVSDLRDIGMDVPEEIRLRRPQDADLLMAHPLALSIGPGAPRLGALRFRGILITWPVDG